MARPLIRGTRRPKAEVADPTLAPSGAAGVAEPLLPRYLCDIESSETAEKFIRRFLDTYERHDLDALWTFYGADCRFPVLERFDIEPSWENYKAFMTRFIDAFPDVHHHIEKLVTDGENIWVLYTMTGIHRGPLRGMQPTGKQVCYPIVAMYRIRDGLIQEADFLSDDLRMMRQIGALPG